MGRPLSPAFRMVTMVARVAQRGTVWAERIKAFFVSLLLVALFAAQPAAGKETEGVSPSSDGSGSEVRTLRMYRNPFQLEHEWVAYGIGDPFVMRWNGRYYLYPSTRTHGGGEIGVRVWVSEDLVDWKYAGYASRDRVTYNAFAPEVVYWDGSFYMYQSSDGQGHYVLKSDDPLGPFTAQTGNIGLSIDGSVFIDDDGSWYFTHAGFRGIRGYRMRDPYTMEAPRLTEADMGAWTEGSMIIKRDGYYFMTYTGNHVRSAGYRIDYAVAQDGPLGPYTRAENNPLLISTDDDFHGLGHNSLVLAPDLDGYMIVYHNIYNRDADHIRKMNIDRLVFNGKKMAALGPTTFPQVAPKLPEFYTWIDEEGIDGRWSVLALGDYELLLSREESASRFTAEFNFQLAEPPRCAGEAADVSEEAGRLLTGSHQPQIGAVVSYRSAGDFIAVVVDPCRQVLGVWQVQGGNAQSLGESRLPAEFDFTKLHTLRIAQEPGRMRVFFDQMLLLETAVAGPAGGKIGYIHRDVAPVFRYTAFSNDAFGSSDRRVPKPVPGRIEAVHFTDGQRAQEQGESRAISVGEGQDFLGPRVIDAGDGTYAVALDRPGDALTYTIHVEKDGLYAVDAMVRNPLDAPVIQWHVDGKTALTSTLSGSGSGGDFGSNSRRNAGGDQWLKVPLGRMELTAGLHTVGLELLQGSVELRRIDLYRVTESPYSLVDSLSQGVSGAWREYGEGRWQSSEFGFRLAHPKDTMIIAGSTEWTDYFVQVEFEVDGKMGPGEAALLLRATQPSYYPDQVRDSVIAYAVTLKDDRLLLQKLNYGSTTLAWVDVRLDGAHVLAAEAKGSHLKVYLDDLETPVLEYTDPDAWMYGAVGLRTNVTHVAFRNLALHCVTCPAYAKVTVGDHAFWLTPHQERYKIVLPFGVTAPPAVETAVQSPDPGVDVIAPHARIEVIEAQAVPGDARVRVWDQDGALLHEATVALTKITTPAVSVDVPGGEGRREGWAGNVAGDVSVVVDVNGPDELLKSVRVTLSRIDFGQVVDEKVLYEGAGVPVGLILDTTELADATYEATVHVVTVYDTEAPASVRFRVANWRERVDELPAPMESIFGLIDRSETVARSDGWAYATDSPGDFFGDRDRLVREANTTEWLVWQAQEPYEIGVTVYARDLEAGRMGALLETVAVDVSKDRSQWVSLPLRVDSVREPDSESGWFQVQLAATVEGNDALDPSGVGYVRVTLGEGDLEAGGLQLGRVRFLFRQAPAGR